MHQQGITGNQDVAVRMSVRPAHRPTASDLASSHLPAPGRLYVLSGFIDHRLQRGVVGRRTTARQNRARP
jgi:hypothetical protein